MPAAYPHPPMVQSFTDIHGSDRIVGPDHGLWPLGIVMPLVVEYDGELPSQ